MLLSGCSSNSGFIFKRGEDNSYVVLEDSFINNSCIDKCYVVEAYNKLTEETELFIAKKETKSINEVYIENGKRFTCKRYYYYTDLMNNDNELFYEDNRKK